MAELDFMAEAARLARDGVTLGAGGPFGAVVVKEGRIVGAAYNCVVAGTDPTAHAEVEAIRQACRALDTFHLDGCELYTTSEPCPMCLGAIQWARIQKVHYAQTRKDAAGIGFDDERFYAENPVEMVHAPHADAAEAFRIWMEKDDRVGY